MAHLSGYDGSITIVGTHSTLLAQITAWTLRQLQDTFLANAKSPGLATGWKTRFATAKEWEADIEFLVQQDTAVNAALVGAVITTLELIAKTAADTNLSWHGTAGFLSGLEISDPLDGPVTARGTVGGSGAMTQTPFDDVV